MEQLRKGSRGRINQQGAVARTLEQAREEIKLAEKEARLRAAEREELQA